jgi:hypothetical protein
MLQRDKQSAMIHIVNRFECRRTCGVYAIIMHINRFTVNAFVRYVEAGVTFRIGD